MADDARGLVPSCQPDNGQSCRQYAQANTKGDIARVKHVIRLGAGIGIVTRCPVMTEWVDLPPTGSDVPYKWPAPEASASSEVP